MKRLDGIIDPQDVSLSKLPELVKDWEACCASVCGQTVLLGRSWSKPRDE